MLYVSREKPEATEARLRLVLARASIALLEGPYAFRERPVTEAAQEVGREVIAVVRDDSVWSLLVPARLAEPGAERFRLIRIHFPEALDNSGFVGWLATHLKRALGTGVFVICGHNNARGGIFDYTGFPEQLADAVVAELQSLGGQIG